MRIEEIRATSFGPFRGRSLNLTPGLNVIHGPNESGKSSWFAATYAGLVGRRRARGRGTSSQAAFAQRHKPWSGSQWSAGVTITLQSGTQLAIEHDLRKGESRIIDSESGRPVAVGELERRLGFSLMSESTLDGARLLGLNRDTARATLFIGQADVLRVLEDAGELQELLERAATSETADVTAEAALAWLATQRAEQVGVPHVGQRPLRARTLDLQGKQGAAHAARDRLNRLIDVLTEQRKLHGQSTSVKEQLDDLQRMETWVEIYAQQRDVTQARQLVTQLGAGPNGSALVDESLSRQAAMVLGAYESRGSLPPPPGRGQRRGTRGRVSGTPRVSRRSRGP